MIVATLLHIKIAILIMHESSQLYDLSTNETLNPMFPNLHTFANVCMSLPVGREKLFKKEKNKNSTQKQIILKSLS